MRVYFGRAVSVQNQEAVALLFKGISKQVRVVG